MLSRLHRKAEALDAACLRALGHPHDHAVRQELLSALEWDTSYRPEHARPQIRSLFKEEFVGEGLKLKGAWSAAGTLALEDLRLDGGWLILGWQMPDNPAVAAGGE